MPAFHQTFPASTSIASASYEPIDERTGTLTVVFKNSRQPYVYRDVPPDVYEGLTAADSPGTFWRNSIKDRYG